MPPVKYQEGDWFGVPLEEGGFGVGVVARIGAYRIPFGYFFGPRRNRLPTVGDVTSLKAADALLDGNFGDTGLRYGEWPIIGQVPGWDRRAWPERIYDGLMGHGYVEGRLGRLLADPDKRGPEPPPSV